MSSRHVLFTPLLIEQKSANNILPAREGVWDELIPCSISRLDNPRSRWPSVAKKNSSSKALPAFALY
ncbi:hypothetical protein BAUCODRAFT_37317 [Baudoinia panamericana UAMH 10762]|uniref:Uncharacterized protein n=1 Tax=Baudoinia panamericana (strain UAMH 10762) TaxID=717646 RepID=M2MQ82_BAUPA|nr:uncharacterized protein BAUCODRAFT_37317 [Baudoinia panamericana UAMH 10762]EMC93628.1 hypothetical protein BAUCODRAFT_37317 [Baudoinia panamericana UAMH 10762]